MMSILKTTICAAALMGMSGHAMAATVSSASASLDVSIVDVFALDDDGGSANIVVSGDGSYSVRARASGLDARDSDSVEGALRLVNDNDFAVVVSFGFTADAGASTSVDDEMLVNDLRFDSNARVDFDAFRSGDLFVSTNGSYSCDNADPDSDTFNCFGVFEDDSDGLGGSREIFLDPNETRVFDFELTAFAFGQAVVEPTPSPVPLPAGGLLLLTGLGLLGWRARRG